MSEQLRLMAVHAHPDDESSKGAATMARYASEGVDVLVVTLTGGEAGSVLNHAMDRPEIHANLPRVRQQEMDQAREILGVRQVWLGFVDSGFPQGDPPSPLPEGCFALQPVNMAASRLVRVVREHRPHVMVTYDENGGLPHPDHIMCHRVSVAAFEAAGNSECYPDAGEPWQPLKLYYERLRTEERFQALHDGMLARGLESPYEEQLARLNEETWKAPEVTTRVDCGAWFETRDRALLAHATQIDPHGPWFACPLEVQRQTWPTEDYHLARSLVGTTLPENDLFVGVRESV